MANYTNVEDHHHLDKVADMVVVNVKHTFTEQELDEQAQLLAQAVNDKQSEEAEKKVRMAEFKTKIDTLQSKVNLYANYITNGFMFIDKPAEMYRDYDRAKRVYFDKATGDFLQEENFHASDYQKKIDFDEREEQLRKEDIARQQQIEENNSYAPVDEVIIDKKLGGNRHGNLTDINPVSFDDDELPDDDELFKDIK